MKAKPLKLLTTEEPHLTPTDPFHPSTPCLGSSAVDSRAQFLTPRLSALFLIHVSDGILSQMPRSLNINRTMGNKSGDCWYDCLVPGLKGISAHDLVFT